MNQKIILPLIAFSSVLFSCKKDEIPETLIPETVYENYSNLKVGNYWIYQRFNVDESGNETATNLYDSCYVEKDTMINSKKYFKYVNSDGVTHGTPGYAEYLKDSLHYIVSRYGNIMFSSQDFTNNLGQRYHVENMDTMIRYTLKMADKDAITSVPYGDFTTSNAQIEVYTYPGYTFAANPRYKNTRYAKNIGIVTKMFDYYWGLASYTELRLVRYHVH